MGLEGRLARGMARNCAVLAACAALAGPAAGAQHDFNYSVELEERYQQDVFRAGENEQDDIVSSLLLTAGWAGVTPRSTTRVRYQPRYFAYADFSSLNHLEHRADSSWQFSPGRRTQMRLRQGLVLSDEQSAFRDFEDGLEDPIAPRRRRSAWEFEPSVAGQLSRLWDWGARALVRQQRFGGDELRDNRVAGLELSSSARLGAHQRLGGSVRREGVAYEHEDVTSPERFTRFTQAEATWSRDGAPIFGWSASAGAFRAEGDELGAETRPTAGFSLAWNLARSRVGLAYDLGYAASGAVGGGTRSQSLRGNWNRLWGRAFRTAVGAVRIERDRLSGAAQGDQTLEGLSFDLDARYIWLSGLGIQFHHSTIRQDGEAQAATLDYQVVSVGLTYAPRGRTATTTGATVAPGGR